ncbi:MAG: AMP-binding protein [Betaproteobacteria bacterium]
MHGVVQRGLRWILRTQVVGNLPIGKEAILYAAHHASAMDAVLLPLVLPGKVVVVLPKEDLLYGPLRWLLYFCPHLIAEVSDPTVIKKVLRLLASGASVVVYPEGRISASHAVMKVYEIPALIAVKSGVQVMPLRIRYRRGALLPRVRIRVAAPRHIHGANVAASKARRVSASDELQRMLEACAFSERPRMSLFEAFLDAVAEHGRSVPIIEDWNEKPQSYGAVLKGSLAIGRSLASTCAAGENVGVLLPNIIPTVCTVLGLSAFGRVPAMLNYSAGAVAVQSACIAARVSTVITSRAFIEQQRLAAIVAAIANLKLIYLEDVRAEFGLNDKLWLIAYAQWFPRRVMSPGRSTGPGVVVFTSGSEAKPKGVVLSHEAILANITQMASVIDFTPQDKVLNPLPVYHSYSFTAGMMLCLVTGTKLFLYISPLRYRAIPEIAYRRNCTYLFGTSTFLSYYARNANSTDFNSIRRVISGGEKLGADVARAWEEKFGLRIYQGYGATECAPVISLSTPKCYKPGTVGRLLPGLEHRIQKLDGVERGGVLHLRGVQVMLGYYRFDNPGVIDPPRSIYGDGWYDTGDVVATDEDGVMTVVGRVKRFAKIAGEMMSLDTIEEVARSASPEHSHGAVLRTDPATGETTVLFTTNAELTRSHLVHAARKMGCPDLAVARQLIWMQEIPILPTGKTDYVSLETLTVAANAPDASPEGDDSASSPHQREQ